MSLWCVFCLFREYSTLQAEKEQYTKRYEKLAVYSPDYLLQIILWPYIVYLF